MPIVAVIGGGNIGTLMAAEMARRGCEVRMCASDAECWPGTVEVVDDGGTPLYAARLAHLSSDLGSVMPGADWVFVTYPSSAFPSLAQDLCPLLRPGQRLCAVPGADAEFFFAEAIGQGVELLGFQRVHSIARLRERGRVVAQLGKKPSIQLASIPATVAPYCAGELSEMMGMPVEVLPNYLTETLTPSNPILHTSRLASMFSGWSEGMAYPSNILFYETWDDSSSRLLLACDEELQRLCRVVERESGLDLSGVVPLARHYESSTARAMTEKISHIPAFRGILSPMREAEPGAWVPDFSSRYFTADFDIGLRAIKGLADLFGVGVSSIDGVLDWYRRASGVDASGSFVPTTRDKAISLY